MCFTPVTLHRQDGDIKVPCGKCFECLVAQTREWALRIRMEASLYEKNCCITLTYDDEHLPQDGELQVRDYQLFLKSLRKEYGKMRYFLSGEYGSLHGRPHFHCILFGWSPDDLVYKFSRSGEDYFTSKSVLDVWKNGHILVGACSSQTAFYTAKYMQKYLFETINNPYFDLSHRHDDLSPFQKPFVRMSTHPGIGYDYWTKCDFQNDKVYFDGRYYRIPRYFLKVAEQNGVVISDVQKIRMFHAELNDHPYWVDVDRFNSFKEKFFRKIVKST